MLIISTKYTNFLSLISFSGIITLSRTMLNIDSGTIFQSFTFKCDSCCSFLGDVLYQVRVVLFDPILLRVRTSFAESTILVQPSRSRNSNSHLNSLEFLLPCSLKAAVMKKNVLNFLSI